MAVPDSASASSRRAARRVRLLGTLRLEDRAGLSLVPGERSRRLLAYLLLHEGRPQPREVLAARLWPDVPDTRARRHLSHALYRLRQAAGDHWLRTDEAYVALADPDCLWVDAWTFETLCDHGDLGALADAVDLYVNDLLIDLYDDWVIPVRERLRERFLSALLQLGQAAKAIGDHDAALQHFHRLTYADPLYEPGHRGLIETLVALERPVEALAAYRRLEEILDREFGIAPDPEVQAHGRRLAEALQRRQAEQPSSAVGPPFLGRVDERTRLVELLSRSSASRGGLAVVVGEPGIGKSRLLEELAASARWRGWTVSTGTAATSAAEPAYSPLGEALETALTVPRIEQLADLVQPVWLALAARVVPQVGQVLQLPEPRAAPTDREAAVRALTHVAVGLTRVTPHLLLLDDMQWAERHTWAVLERLRHTLVDEQGLVVVAGRTEELRADPHAWDHLHRWDAAGVPLVRLGPLDERSLQTLAATCAPRPLVREELDAVARLTGGNPLLAISWAERVDDASSADAPLTIEAIAAERLSRLTADARRAIRSAATLGRRFEYRLWSAATPDVATDTLPSLAGELERVGLMRAGAEHYRFVHDSLRGAVYAAMTPTERAERHRLAFAALEAVGAEDVGRRLHHARQGGLDTEVPALALTAGQAALDGHALELASTLFTEALEHLPDDDAERRYEALRGRVSANELLGRREAEAEDIAALVALTDATDDPRHRATVARLEATHAVRMGQLAHAERAVERGLAAAAMADDSRLEARLMETMAHVARDRGEIVQAEDWLQRALDRYRAVGDRFGAASARDKLANLQWSRGRLDAAAEGHAEAAEVFAAEGAVLQEATARSGLATVRRLLGDYEAARHGHTGVLERARELGMPKLEWAQMVALGNIATELGDYDTAVEWYEPALALARQLSDPRGESMTLGNLAAAYRDLGDQTAAERCYDEALRLNRERGFRRAEAYNLSGRARARLAADDAVGAVADYEAARALLRELGVRMELAEALAGLALAQLARRDVEAAEATVARALELIEGTDQPVFELWVHYAASQVAAAAGDVDVQDAHLAAARAAMRVTASGLPSAARVRFLEHVPNNRLLRAALRERSRIVRVRLVRDDVPLGRALTDADYVEVAWTVRSPEDRLVDGKARRRRAVLRRLLREAAEQGALPTDDDLAAAVGVSRRTILRDVKQLVAEGTEVRTRRRR